jgi:hypothetical protein
MSRSRINLNAFPDVHPNYVKRTVHYPADDPAALVLEAWSQGLMTGSLVIMAAVTIANMRPGVLLHKLILLEVQ